MGELSWERIEEILGDAAIQGFCDPEESPRMADVDDETCRDFLTNALDYCRELLSGAFPEPQRLGREFLAEPIIACVENEMRHQKIDLEIEVREAYLLSQEPEIVESWSGAIDRIISHYTSNERKITELLGEFSDSGFGRVFSFSHFEVLIIASTRTGDTWTSETVEDPPAWMLEMAPLDIDVVEGVAPILMAFGRPGFETQSHEFTAYLFTEPVDEPVLCDEAFESLECGGCVASRMDGLTLAVTWNSKSLVESLMETDSEGAGAIVDRCIREGAEEARMIEGRARE